MRHELFTISDLTYAARVLVLYRSLARACNEFRLRIFCADDATRRLFQELALPHVRVIDLQAVEAADPALRAVRPDRTTAEYCWTAKAPACLYTFQLEHDVEALTYVDADLMFFHDPQPLYDELGRGSILIVPHRNPARVQWWDRWGIYNAGFIVFRRDEIGMSALQWWRQRCLEWCYARLEDGKSGDQTYLDDWPTRFPGTHALEHVGGGLAPWNITESVLGRDGPTVTVDGVPLVFFHFATLRLYHDRPLLRRLRLLPQVYDFRPYPAPLLWTIARSYERIRPDARTLLWDPYLAALGDAIADIRRIEPRLDRARTHLRAVEVYEHTAPRIVVETTRRLGGAIDELLRRP